MSTCSRVMTAPNPMSAPVAPSMNDSRMKLSLPVSSVIGRGRSVEQARRVDEPPRVERGLLHRDDPVDRGHRAQRVGLEVEARERRLELEQDERQADLGDRLVVADRDADVERLAQIGRDREDEQRVGAGRLEVARLADRGVGRRPGQPGDDRQVGDLARRPGSREPSRRASGAAPRRCRR